jgi:hypothetical protein
MLHQQESLRLLLIRCTGLQVVFELLLFPYVRATSLFLLRTVSNPVLWSHLNFNKNLYRRRWLFFSCWPAERVTRKGFTFIRTLLNKTCSFKYMFHVSHKTFCRIFIQYLLVQKYYRTFSVFIFTSILISLLQHVSPFCTDIGSVQLFTLVLS